MNSYGMMNQAAQPQQGQPNSQQQAIQRMQAFRQQGPQAPMGGGQPQGQYSAMNAGQPRQAPVGPSMLGQQPQAFNPGGMGGSRAGMPLQQPQYPPGTFQGQTVQPPPGGGMQLHQPQAMGQPQLGQTAQAPASPGMQLNQPAAFKPPAPAAPPPSQDPGYNSSYAAFAAANKPTDPYAGMAKGW